MHFAPKIFRMHIDFSAFGGTTNRQSFGVSKSYGLQAITFSGYQTKYPKAPAACSLRGMFVIYRGKHTKNTPC